MEKNTVKVNGGVNERNNSSYFTGLAGLPNLFFLHSVCPKKRPIKALASVV